MGGVIVDVDTRTEIEGLWRSEDVGGAHGANWLAATGCSTVFGGIAGEVMAADIASMNSHRPADETVLSEEMTVPASHIARVRHRFSPCASNCRILHGKILALSGINPA